jgi:prepilin-type N-terminal cleavage/methylation domain-containing protein
MNRLNRDCGFTLLELLCALVVIAILATLSAPLAGSFRARTQGLQCVTNLKGLGTGAAAYMTDHNNTWPQIVRAEADDSNVSPGQREAEVTAKWIEALAPYGVTDKTWRCPTIEAKMRANGAPGAVNAKRLDYSPTQFDKEPGSALQWPSHPWFIERTPSHGLGPRLLQANGRVVSMEDLLQELPVR